jgi:hypothetical protein
MAGRLLATHQQLRVHASPSTVNTDHHQAGSTCYTCMCMMRVQLVEPTMAAHLHHGAGADQWQVLQVIQDA